MGRTKKKENTILRKKENNVDKYRILDLYIYGNMTTREIAEEVKTTPKAVEHVISRLYKDFQNIRETKLLVLSSSRPDLFETMKSTYIDPDNINESFLALLSEEDSPVLTDHEVIFCHVFVDTGDDVKAIKEAKMAVGLKGARGGNVPLAAMRARAYYLKKKPNITNYISSIRKDNLKVLKESKEYLQANLIDLIEQLKNSNDPKNASNILKAMDTLAKITGDFDNKSTLEIVSGDDGLDRILKKAKEAKSSSIPESIEVEDGIEIYED